MNGTSLAHASLDSTRAAVLPLEPDKTSLLAGSGLGLHTLAAARKKAQLDISYPKPPRDGGVTETLHGVTVSDPWRSFELLDTAETQAYIKQQNDLSKPFLEAVPARAALERVVHRSYSYERITAPKLQGDGYYYWMYNAGDWARDVVVRSQNLKRDFGRNPKERRTTGAGPEVVLDLNKEDRTSMYAYSWSPDGRYFTAVLQASGSDWQTIRTVDTTTALHIEPELFESKFTFGVTWINSLGFLYKRPIARENSASADHEFAGKDGQFGYWYHHLGTTQSEDTLVWYGTGEEGVGLIVGRPHVMAYDETAPGDKWMFWDMYRNTNPETEVLVCPLPNLEGKSGVEVGRALRRSVMEEMRWLATGWTGETTYVGTLANGTHILQSNTDGIEAGRILSLSPTALESQTATLSSLESDPRPLLPVDELVPADPSGRILQSAHLVANSILALVYLSDASALVVFHDVHTGEAIASSNAAGTTGHAHTYPPSGVDIPIPPENGEQRRGPHATLIPQHASVASFSSKVDASDFYVAVDTFVSPPYVLAGTVAKPVNGEKEPEVTLSRLDAVTPAEDDLVCSQVFYESFDGVKVPMFLCHARDLDLGEPQPVLLHAYGGSAVPITPHFNPLFTSFMRNVRGIVAVANIRGGGEYGKAWHDCASGLNRHICFEDMEHAARYLHKQRLATPAKTAIYGSSNGGLLVGACTNRHPELFGAIMCDVGVLDMIRFTLFGIGRLWTAEYGDPACASDLPGLLAYSPVHNVTSSKPYPAVLVTTGDHDTRVIPSHSLKFLAALQSKAQGGPFLGRIYENAGHESGSKSTEQKVGEALDRLSFLIATLAL